MALESGGGNTRSVGRAGRWFSQALRFGEHAAGDSLLIREEVKGWVMARA